jgi:hypothetical protein
MAPLANPRTLTRSSSYVEEEPEKKWKVDQSIRMRTSVLRLAKWPELDQL